MESNEASFDPGRLCEHQRFLAGLARALVADEHAAEDLIQDTWVAALEHAPADVSRGWLGRVLRNRSSNRFKLRARRTARERQAARGEAVELDPLEELDLQARVLAAVRELPEPYRRVIWLTYWRGLGASRIAADQGVPLPTVKSRLARGRALLRERLSRELGNERHSWSTLLLASLPTSIPGDINRGPLLTVAKLAGATLMGTKAKLILAATVLAVGTYVAWDARRPTARALAPGNELVRGDVELLRADTPGAVRAEVAAPAAASKAPSPAVAASSSPVPAAPVELRGRVLDDEVRPVAGVEVVLSGAGAGDERGRTDAAGAFRFRAAEFGRDLRVDDPAWVTIGPAMAQARPAGPESIVLAARRVPLYGLVVDEGGLPLPGAAVSLELPGGFRSRFPHVLDNTLSYRPRTESNAEGRFELDDAVRVAGSQIICERDGFLVHRTPLDTVAGEEVTLVLRRTGSLGETLRGQVVDPRGRPVEAASVSFGAEVVRTDATGAFELLRTSELSAYDSIRRAIAGESRTLSALKPGFLPGSVEVELDAEGRPLWPDGVVVQLGGEPLSIQGRVVDPSGAPLAGVTLWLDRVQVFSMVNNGTPTEALLAGSDERHTTFATDRAGRFEIPGLLDQDYVVAAMHEPSGVIVHSGPTPAGKAELDLILDPGAVRPVVSGTVLSPVGERLPGLSVLVMTDANDQYFAGEFVRTSSLMLRRATTDEYGEFVLQGVPRDNVYLEVFGDGVELTVFPLRSLDGGDFENLELIVARRVHFQVTLAEAGEADQVELLDGAGEPLGMRVYRGKPGPAMLRAPIFGERTEVLSVSEAGRTLVFYKDGEEVRRRLVALEVGELNEF